MKKYECLRFRIRGQVSSSTVRTIATTLDTNERTSSVCSHTMNTVSQRATSSLEGVVKITAL